MPSIEIVAVKQLRPTAIESLPFAVKVDLNLKSHRSPSRFQADFDSVSGVLYHLGNPDLKADSVGRAFFAWKLLSRESQTDATFLEFAGIYRPRIAAFFDELIRDSPVHQLIFTSDWQFGPEWTNREAEITLDRFWQLHDSRQVHLNALYPIVGS